jgi:hypothetical protein
MKAFFENPELLLGAPMLVLGALGIAVALGVAFMYWINPTPSR